MPGREKYWFRRWNPAYSVSERLPATARASFSHHPRLPLIFRINVTRRFPSLFASALLPL